MEFFRNRKMIGTYKMEGLAATQRSYKMVKVISGLVHQLGCEEGKQVHLNERLTRLPGAVLIVHTQTMLTG